MSKGNVINLIRLLEHPVTGGEIYNYKLDRYLKTRFNRVENIFWPNHPHRNAWEFILNSLKQNAFNLSLLRNFSDIDGDLVIMEDGSQSADLFLFNISVRCFRVIMGKKIRIVSIIHHIYAPLEENILKRALMSIEEGLFANSLDGIIVPSEFTKSLVDRMLKRHIDILIAHPGLNISGSGEKKAKFDEGIVSLLFVGYIIQRKGVDTLVRALDILVKGHGMENLILHIVGDTERDKDFFRSIKEYCENVGIEDHLVFHGRVSENDLRNLYKTADIFVFPSLWEGFGIVLAEAMSYGLPVVTTNAGAMPYLVKDGRNGFLVPPHDAEKLAQSIKMLVVSPELIAEFGEANRKVAAEFSWEKSFAEIEVFLEGFIDG